MLCKACGIGTSEAESLYCAKLGKICPESTNKCNYYIEKQYEEGEPLSPGVHLFMKEQELQSRKISGARPFNIGM